MKPIVFAAMFSLLAFSSFATAQNNASSRDKINMGTTPSSQSAAANLGKKGFSMATPEIRCYSIRRITLVDESRDGVQTSSQFYWALERAKRALQVNLPHCFGEQGLSVLTKQIQSEITNGGYNGIRVVKPQQDLHSGSLVLSVLLSGKENQNTAKKAASSSSKTTNYTNGFTPSVSNKNPNAMEQYENAVRKVKANGGTVSVSVAKTNASSVVNRKAEKVVEEKTSIVSSKTLNASSGVARTEVKTAKNMPKATERRETKGEKQDSQASVSGQVRVSGSGSSSKGKWQAEAELTVRDIIAYNDRLDIEAAHSTKQRLVNSAAKFNKHVGVSYEVPFGDWRVSASHRLGTLSQHIFRGEGRQDDLQAGKFSHSRVNLGYMLIDNDARQTSLSASLWSRQFKDDDRLVAKQRLSGWAFGATHREWIGKSILDFAAEYKQAFSAKGMEEKREISRPQIIRAELSWYTPFELAAKAFYVQTSLKGQWSRKPLDIMEQFTLGGVNSVRGLSASRLIAGAKGWLSRNELGWHIQDNKYTLYTAVDVGQVSGENSEQRKPTFASSLIGLKGQRKMFQYDLFVAKPLSRPKGFKVPRYLVGATLSYRF